MVGIVIGLAVVTMDGITALDGVVAFALVLFVVWRAVPRSLELGRIRDVMVIELAVTATSVTVTGGWASPWLASFVVTLGLAALGLSLGRATALAVAAVAVTSVATLLPTGRDVGTGGELVTWIATMLIVVLTGALTRRALLEVGGPIDESLGRLETLWSVHALLEGLHGSVLRTPGLFSVQEALMTLRSSSPSLGRAAVVAVFAAESDGGLRPVAGVGIADSPPPDAVPPRVRTATRDGAVTTLPLGDGHGFAERSDHGSYVWLPMAPEVEPHLLVVETDAQDVSIDDVAPELRRLVVPLAVTIANAGWFERVRSLSADEERQRIAARLHDQFAQSLAVVSMELDLALRRHPDDDGLVELRGHVRDSLSDLRDTMVELRAHVTEEDSLEDVLHTLVARVDKRDDVAASMTAAGDGPRASLAVEQQLLRIAQELVRRAVQDRRATHVDVRVHRGRAALVVEVRDDGAPPSRTSRVPVGEVVAERIDAIGGSVTTYEASPGVAAVRVEVASSDPRPDDRALAV